VPVLQRRLQQAQLEGTLNPFVELICRACAYECEAQLALFRAQSEGRIPHDELARVQRKLDRNGDGHITRNEFMANATSVFFSSLLEEVTNEAMIASMSAAASSPSKTRPSLVLQSIENEAQLAGRLSVVERVDGARRRVDDFTAYTKRIQEDKGMVVHEIEHGVRTMRHASETQRLEAEQSVRNDGATTLVALELAVAGSSDVGVRAASVRLFALLSQQLVAGLGTPNEQQLLALFRRYDEDGNGVLSRGEIAHLIADYSAARAGQIETQELPGLRASLKTDGSNQFVCLLTRARVMAKEAELALFKSQAEGQVANADLCAMFNRLDTNRDGMISKDEFSRGMADVLFATQLERIQKWTSVLNDAAKETEAKEAIAAERTETKDESAIW